MADELQVVCFVVPLERLREGAVLVHEQVHEVVSGAAYARLLVARASDEVIEYCGEERGRVRTGRPCWNHSCRDRSTTSGTPFQDPLHVSISAQS